MIILDRKIFWAQMRAVMAKQSPGGVFTADQVSLINQVLDCAQDEQDLTSMRQFAYMLSTFWTETNHFLTLKEYGGRAYFRQMYGAHTRKGRELGNIYGTDAENFSGKGLVQVTGRGNAIRITKLLAKITGSQMDFAKNPQALCQFPYAWQVAYHGMKEGWYCSRRVGSERVPYTLEEFIPANDYSKTDYVGARAIINYGQLLNSKGKIVAREIADRAVIFERILRAAQIEQELALDLAEEPEQETLTLAAIPLRSGSPSDQETLPNMTPAQDQSQTAPGPAEIKPDVPAAALAAQSDPVPIAQADLMTPMQASTGKDFFGMVKAQIGNAWPAAIAFVQDNKEVLKICLYVAVGMAVAYFAIEQIKELMRMWSATRTDRQTVK